MFSYIVACLVVFGIALSTAEVLESHDRNERANEDKDVVRLTDNNFDDYVLKSDAAWLVEFYAPWCGYCKKLAPHWAQAATALKGQMKLGALDATEYTKSPDKYGVKGYPTIKYFPAGNKYGKHAEEYDGGQTAADIIQWATAKLG